MAGAGSTMFALTVKLGALLAPKYALMAGVRGDVLFLRAELESMHALLEKLSAVHHPDSLVKCWMKEVRELAYHIEDSIDEFMHCVDARGTVMAGHGPGALRGLVCRVTRLVSAAWTHHRLANQVRGLKARVIEVSERRLRYNLGDGVSVPARQTAVDTRLNALYADTPDLVGVDGAVDDIVSWLVEGTCRRKVLSIVGFGGLGKTTLAMTVYRKVRGRFDCQASVAASQKLDMKRLLRDLLSQVGADGVHRTDLCQESQLIRRLRECLENKRYFIIIDDVWSKSAWEKVRCALPENNHHSRLITTTRIKSVARLCCSHPNDDLVYRIKPLNESDAKILFFKRIFGHSDGCPLQFKQISDQILKKCCGSPLAIISIASLLASKPVMLKEQWEKVHSSLGSALEKNSNLEAMKQILSLSYHDLPYHLKACMLYFSLYPEDYKVERDSLIRQWIAEGFICEERGCGAEDVAESYFNELINRSMIEPMDIDCDGKARACRVHDVMLELIISKSVEENFVTLIGGHPVASKPQGDVRRLSIQCDPEIVGAIGGISLCHARSLILSVQAYLIPPLSEFRVLRVLDLTDCQGLNEHHLKDISILFHLKYMSLRRTWISNLPPQIGDLQTLETLDIRDTNIEELPEVIAGLSQLRYILAGGYAWGKVKLPDGIGNMKSLRVISGFDICRSSTDAVRELGGLKNLKDLEVNWSSYNSNDMKHQETMLRAALDKLGTCNLQSLAVYSRCICSLEFLDTWSPPPNHLQRFRISALYFLPRVPKWMASLSNLIDVNINLEELANEDIQILRELPSLLRLDLWLKPTQKDKIIVHGMGFSYLKEFFFCCDGACLMFEQAAMPKLEKLQMTIHTIRAKAYGFHFGIEHLVSLKQIDIQACCDDASTSDVKNFEHAIHTVVEYHPNHARINIQKYGMNLQLYERNKKEHLEDNNVEKEDASQEDMRHENKKRRLV